MNVKSGPRGASPRGGRKAEQSEATRAALISAGRRLFGERGYGGVGTEDIVRAAGVTRGALYHHFGGKSDLLEAVYREVEEEITARIAEVALGSGATSPVESMRAGIAMFIDACAEPEVQRIVLLDAPAVLGWDRWREIAASYGVNYLPIISSARGDAARPRADRRARRGSDAGRALGGRGGARGCDRGTRAAPGEP